MTYKLKQIPEDFTVREVFDIDKILSDSKDYTYFVLKKKMCNTTDAVVSIAKFLGVHSREIGYAGAKDKRAMTTQYCSAKGNIIGKLEHFKNNRIGVEVIGNGAQPISLGDHEGNEFEITIRYLDNTDFTKKIKSNKFEFINTFGEQRFGRNNVEIGLAMIKGNFKEAVELIKASHPSFGIDEHLKKSPNDYVGSIRQYPRRLLTMFVYAYQSKIWNKLALKFEEDIIPVPGFGVEYENSEIKSFVEKELEIDNLTFRDFIIRELPEIRAEGTTRQRVAIASELEIKEISEDNLNKGRKKVVLKFRLPKGSYATEFIKQLILGIQK